MRYRFGDYVLDTQRHELHHAGVPIQLRRKVFRVLVYLLVHRDRVVSKQELLARLWPDQFVREAALTSCIRALRRALGERGRTPRYLRTLHSQGYRFMGAVEAREHLPGDDVPHVFPLHGGEGAIRQADGPSPAGVPKAPLAGGCGAGTRSLAAPTGGGVGRAPAAGTAAPHARAAGVPLCAPWSRGTRVCVQACADPRGWPTRVS